MIENSTEFFETAHQPAMCWAFVVGKLRGFNQGAMGWRDGGTELKQTLGDNAAERGMALMRLVVQTDPIRWGHHRGSLRGGDGIVTNITPR